MVSVAEALHREPATSAILIVTARATAEEVLRTVAHARRHARVVVADCCADDDADRAGRARERAPSAAAT